MHTSATTETNNSLCACDGDVTALASSNLQYVSSINPHAWMSACAHVLMCGLAVLSADKSSYDRN